MAGEQAHLSHAGDDDVCSSRKEQFMVTMTLPILPPLPPPSPGQDRHIPDGTMGRHAHAAQQHARHHPTVTPERMSTMDVPPGFFPNQPTRPAAMMNQRPFAQQGSPTGIVPFPATAHGQPAPPGFDPYQYEARATQQAQALFATTNAYGDPRGFSPRLAQVQAQAMQPQAFLATATNPPPGFTLSQEQLMAAGFARMHAMRPRADLAWNQGTNTAIRAQELEEPRQTQLLRVLADAAEQRGCAVAPAPPQPRPDPGARNQPLLVHSPHGSLQDASQSCMLAAAAEQQGRAVAPPPPQPRPGFNAGKQPPLIHLPRGSPRGPSHSSHSPNVDGRVASRSGEGYECQRLDDGSWDSVPYPDAEMSSGWARMGRPHPF